MSQYPSYEAAPIAPEKRNTLALISMIAGIVGWVFFLLTFCVSWIPVVNFCVAPVGCLTPLAWIAAVITGHIGLNQIKQTAEAGNGMAKAGLIMGYIGIGLFVLLTCISIVLIATGTSIPIIDSILNQGYYY